MDKHIKEEIEKIVDGVFLHGKETPQLSGDLPEGQYTVSEAVDALTILVEKTREETIEEVIQSVQENHKGTFTDDVGNDCWYIDDLVKALQHLLFSINSNEIKEIKN